MTAQSIGSNARVAHVPLRGLSMALLCSLEMLHVVVTFGTILVFMLQKVLPRLCPALMDATAAGLQQGPVAPGTCTAHEGLRQLPGWAHGALCGPGMAGPLLHLPGRALTALAVSAQHRQAEPQQQQMKVVRVALGHIHIQKNTSCSTVVHPSMHLGAHLVPTRPCVRSLNSADYATCSWTAVGIRDLVHLPSPFAAAVPMLLPSPLRLLLLPIACRLWARALCCCGGAQGMACPSSPCLHWQPWVPCSWAVPCVAGG